jgi:hypothetical protein
MQWNFNCDPLEAAILTERLRQARYSFNMAIVNLTICGIAELCSLGLVLNGKIPEGSIVSAGAVAPITVFIQLVKDSNRRLDEILDSHQAEKADE